MSEKYIISKIGVEIVKIWGVIVFFIFFLYSEKNIQSQNHFRYEIIIPKNPVNEISPKSEEKRFVFIQP